MRSTFDIVRRGYDCSQVDYQLEQLQADLQIAAADRDAGAAQAVELARQLEAARAELDDMRIQVRQLAKPPTTVEGMSVRVARMLHTAQDEVAEITAKATAAAAAIRADAEHEADELRSRYEQMIGEAQHRRSEMEAEHERALAEGRRRAGQIVALAQQRSDQLDAESAARRQQADEDFDITLSARRREAMRALAEEESTSKSEAQRRVDEATDVARRLVTEADQTAVARIQEATRRVEELRTVRRQLTEQLLSVRTKLENAFEHLAPAADEDSVLAGVQARSDRPAASPVSARGRPAGPGTPASSVPVPPVGR
ncbi:MAG TPA: chromosome segregation protein [Pseudonocardiaceae bacterium]|jgi:chromosome segregation ATPase|nr:chromosome segregation protein [Pseudonocardiaceae bacterium]